MTPEDAGALLSSTQQLRTHWSGVITSHLGIAITINVAIWSYFLTSYMKTPASGNEVEPAYILIVSCLSAILLGLWRLNTRYIDDHIASLYPDFILYEGILNAPFNRSTSGYLFKEISCISPILKSNDFNVEDKANLIDLLVDDKRMGNRGHFKIDMFVLIIVVVITVLSIYTVLSTGIDLSAIILFGNAVGLLCIFVALTRFQKNPTCDDVNSAIQKYSDRAVDSD